MRFRLTIFLAWLLVLLEIGPLEWLATRAFHPYGGHLSGCVYAAQSGPKADISGSDGVDFEDFVVLAAHWLAADCNEPDWCEGADLDQSGKVDGNDLGVFALSWLAGKEGDLSIRNASRYPTRLAIGPDGKVFVSDARVGSVFIYDSGLNLTGELKGLAKPLAVTVGSNGRIYVGNNGRDNVEIYRSDGGKMKTIGAGTIKMPNDMALDADGNLYVVDSANHIVWVYDAQYNLVRTIGGVGSGNGKFNFPVAVTVAYPGGGPGELYVADQGNFLVQVFDLNGTFLRSFGGKVTEGMMGYKWKGKFVTLQSLAMDTQGRLHASDCYANKVQILDRNTGSYIDSYGAYGSDPCELNLPLGLAINDANEVIVANTENKRVEVIYTIP
jgi:DNA-binding beta-propeller fold protein YncE